MLDLPENFRGGKLTDEQSVEIDKAFVQFNKNMNNKMENINEAREMLIEFSKLYKASLEDDVPLPLKQYKTWKEYEELLAY